jgi:hypothetical protein
VEAARKHGKAVGRPLVNVERYGQFAEEGFIFFQAQTEINLMAAGAEAYLKPLQKWCPSIGPRPMY